MRNRLNAVALSSTGRGRLVVHFASDGTARRACNPNKTFQSEVSFHERADGDALMHASIYVDALSVRRAAPEEVLLDALAAETACPSTASRSRSFRILCGNTRGPRHRDLRVPG